MTWAESIPGLMTFSATSRRTGGFLLCEEDDAHSPLADLAGERVRADAAARDLGDQPGRARVTVRAGGRVGRLFGPRSRAVGGRIEEVARLLVRPQQRLNAAAEFGIARAGHLQVGGPVGRVGLPSAATKIVSSVMIGFRV